MSHAKTISELRSVSDEKLVEQHDALAANTGVGISYYLEELARRRADKQARLMIRLTWIIVILTAINVVVVVADLAG
jgi:hypothetical protein